MRTSSFSLLLAPLLLVGTSVSASELLRWDGTPGSVENELPRSIAGVVHEWPVDVNLRDIVANADARRSIDVDVPGESDLTFKMINFNEKSGFIVIGEDEDIDVVPDPDAPDESLSYFWYGSSEHHQMTISVWRGRMVATIQAEGRSYSVSARESRPVLQEFDLARMPRPFDLDDEQRSESPKTASWSMPIYKNIVDTVDVLFVHTADALAEVSNDPALLNAAVVLAEDQLNQALNTSAATTVRVRNVMSGPDFSEFVSYDENSGHTCTGASVEGCRWVGHRIWLRTDATVDSLRSAYGADVVVMLVGDGVDIGGVAYTQRPNCGVLTGYENTAGCD